MFVCDICGTKFTKKDKFCPKCLMDDDIDLVGYCPKCNRLTEHEDGFDIKTGQFHYFCMECVD